MTRINILKIKNIKYQPIQKHKNTNYMNTYITGEISFIVRINCMYERT